MRLRSLILVSIEALVRRRMLIRRIDSDTKISLSDRADRPHRQSYLVRKPCITKMALETYCWIPIAGRKHSGLMSMDIGALVITALANLRKQSFLPWPKRGMAYQSAMCLKLTSSPVFQQ